MKTFIIYTLFTYLALCIQAILFKGVKPDLVLVLICFYSLRQGQMRGLAYGAFSGLLLDTVSGFILGPHMISKSIAGYFIGILKEQLFQWNFIISTFVVIVFSIVNIVVVYLVFETFSRVSFANRSFELSVMEVIYTIIASLALYPLFKPVQEGLGSRKN